MSQAYFPALRRWKQFFQSVRDTEVRNFAEGPDSLKTTPTTQRISDRLGLGAFYLVVSRLIVRSLGMVNIAIFARLLSPTDFGTMALATASFAIIQSLGTINFANAIVREKNPDQSIFETAFTLNFIRGVAVGGMVLIIAYFWGDLWLPPEAQGLLMAMALIPLIGGFHSPRIAQVEADMRYGKIMVAMSISKVVCVVIGVSIALIYQNYWAFFAGMLSQRFLEVVSSIYVAPYRPRFSFNATRKLFGFSIWLLVAEAIMYFERQIGILAIGSKFGVVPASYLSVSRDLTYIVSDDILLSMSRVLYPALSKFSDEADKFRQNAIKSIGLAYLIAVPLCFGLAAVAEPAIKLILTDKFAPAILLIQIIASAYAIQAIVSPTTACALAANRTKWLFIARTVSAILSIPILLLLIYIYGLTGAAIGIGAGFVISAIIHTLLFVKIIDAEVKQIISVSWKTFCAGIAMVSAIYYLYPFVQIDPDNIHYIMVLVIELFSKVIIGGVTYTSAIFAMWYLSGKPESAESRLLEIFGKAVAKLNFKKQ